MIASQALMALPSVDRYADCTCNAEAESAREKACVAETGFLCRCMQHTRYLVNACAASTLFALFLVSDVYGAGVIFSPGSVSVKQNGKNSVEAKNRALTRAARLSFEKMLKEYYSLEKKDASGISDHKISECVSDYSMEHEKQSDSYYIAELSYRFSKDAVDDLLASRGLIAHKSRDTSREVTIVVSMHDFMENAEHFRTIKHKICRFSKEIVVMNVAAKYLNGLKAIGVLYAVK